MNPTVSKATAMAAAAGPHRKDSTMLKFKIMMLGDAGVGKTSIARRFTDENFLPTYIHTIGIDFLEKTIRFNNSTDDSTEKEVPQIDAKLQIWDTAGQDRFRTIIRPYYRGAAGIVLAYDVTDAKTFQNVEEWITSIYENTQTCQVIQKVLLANKIDLPTDLHEVSREAGQKLAFQYGIQYYETSAKDGIGVEEAFTDLAMLCHRSQMASKANAAAAADTPESGIRLEEIPVNGMEERRCCGMAGGGQSRRFSSTTS